MALLEDLEELRLSLDHIVTKSRTMGLSDLLYLLRMASLEIMEKQQDEMDRIERDNSRSNLVTADLNHPTYEAR